METYCKEDIRRGDIYYADLSLVVGSEQGGVRPVVVIQNDVGNRYSPTVIVAPITSRSGKAPLPTHVNIARTAPGLHRNSVIMLEQLRTLDRSKLQNHIGSLGKNEMLSVDYALVISMGLTNGYQ